MPYTVHPVDDSGEEQFKPEFLGLPRTQERSITRQRACPSREDARQSIARLNGRQPPRLAILTLAGATLGRGCASAGCSKNDGATLITLPSGCFVDIRDLHTASGLQILSGALDPVQKTTVVSNQ